MKHLEYVQLDQEYAYVIECYEEEEEIYFMDENGRKYYKGSEKFDFLEAWRVANRLGR